MVATDEQRKSARSSFEQLEVALNPSQPPKYASPYRLVPLAFSLDALRPRSSCMKQGELSSSMAGYSS